jgi:NDP-sugar pyrophosphorylase family protein
MKRVRALVMAGGRSERMRNDSGGLHKALVEIDGVSLLERNLAALAANGFSDVVVVHAPDEPAIGQRVEAVAPALERRYGGRIATWLETAPLGNIGAARVHSDAATDVLVIYVDNLSALNLRDMVAVHQRTGAAMTIAAHSWELRNPFGELTIDAGEVRAYAEKPVRVVRVSSGTCVVAPEAAAHIPAGVPFGAAALYAALARAGLAVRAFEHAAPWIDVNDGRALADARAAVRRDPAHFTP